MTMFETSTPIAPPKDKTELLKRAQALAGLSIGEVAAKLQISVPFNLKRKKGWQGQFLEYCLGADSGNLSQPDFAHLNIELKSLPIDFQGRVLESTYVCVFNLAQTGGIQFFESTVFHKLQHVLWVPVAREKSQSVVDYKIATPFLWRPTALDLNIIEKDWEFAMQQVAMGKIDTLSAKQGEILQVRPKGANAQMLTKTTNRQGETIETMPRGFYLRAQFTQRILQEQILIC